MVYFSFVAVVKMSGLGFIWTAMVQFLSRVVGILLFTAMSSLVLMPTHRQDVQPPENFFSLNNNTFGSWFILF